MSRRGITGLLSVFVATVLVGLVLGWLIGGMVGYATEWTATGAISGVALGLITSQR
jgi:hypothetical protein